jgi:Domain of unknown function (DUF4294)
MFKAFILVVIVLFTRQILFGATVNLIDSQIQYSEPDTTFRKLAFPSHDSILHLSLLPIEIVGPYQFKNKRDERKYNRLESDMRKAYPLALIVSSELKIVNQLFESVYTDPSTRKTYIKWYQHYVYKTYFDSLRTLNEEQGRLLLRLIHRETGRTPYDLIKSYRGGLNAFFWQGLAFLAGGNLNSKYDPEENEMIEHIIRRYRSTDSN